MISPQSLRSSIPSEESTRHFDPVLRPDLSPLYAQRAERLRALAQGHELSDYLRLAASVTDAQASCLVEDTVLTATHVDPVTLSRSGDWPAIMDRMIDHLRPVAPDPVVPHLDQLASMSETVRREAVLAMVEGRFGDVDAAMAPFLWAAFSVEVARIARSVDLPVAATETAYCPVCGSVPVGSLIHTGDRQGLRYLHCTLCECEWHMVRAKCSNCGDAGQLEYLCFDDADAAIRAESCGACGSYLKVISQEREQKAEVVADDLASLVLDDAAQAEGYGRSGFNPFALPG